MSLLKTLNKKIYLDWIDYGYICMGLVMIYFAIACHLFLIRNPLANLNYRYSFVFRYPVKIISFQKLDDFQYNEENFINILKREGVIK